MFRVIPVLDLRGGIAVHAVAGDRLNYRPVVSTLRGGSDPISLAESFRDVLDLKIIYLADLDAIQTGTPNDSVYQELAGGEIELWVDPGVRDSSLIDRLLDAGVSRIVVGLETILGPKALREIVLKAGSDRVVFSLDLVAGVPRINSRADWKNWDVQSIAREVIDQDINTIIVLDLARVGTSQGLGTTDLLSSLISEFPRVNWLAGGGVAGMDDLTRLRAMGASGALVASALHDGRIGSDDLRRFDTKLA